MIQLILAMRLRIWGNLKSMSKMMMKHMQFKKTKRIKILCFKKEIWKYLEGLILFNSEFLL
jgi:hypothetical protein